MSAQTRMILTGGTLFIGTCMICILMPSPNEPTKPANDVADTKDGHEGHFHGDGHDHSGDANIPNKPDAKIDDTFELDKKVQKLIWDAEHITFELESKFGAAFKKHLDARNVVGLRSLIQDDAKIQLPQETDRTEASQAGVSQIQSTSKSFAASDADGLVEHLVQLVSTLDTIERIKLRVLKIHAAQSDKETPDNSWKTSLLLSAVGKTAEGAMQQVDSNHEASFVIDDENELGDASSVSAWSITSSKIRTGAQPLMKEVTADVGLKRLSLIDNWELPSNRQPTQYRYQIAVADYNKDGLLDIAVAGYKELTLLSRPSADKPYHETTFAMFLKKKNDTSRRSSNLAAWIDFDNDGWPDLLLGSRLYHNENGQRFNDVTGRCGLKFGLQAMGAHVVDYDCDGLLDLYILEQGFTSDSNEKMSWIDDSQHGMPNTLWKNMGGGVFKDVTKESNAGGGKRESLSACWFFYDSDRFPDLYIANDFGSNLLLRNQGDGTFEDISKASETSDFATTMGAVAGDLDNDSISELYVANMYSKMGRRIIGQVKSDDYPAGVFKQIQGSCAGNRLYWRKKDQTEFDEKGSSLGVDAVGWAYAPAMIDFNNDGLLDLYATTGFLSFDRKKPDG
jgi:hypothetical protein